ncbi:MAG: hypothetical protein H6Q67_775 [Firmicutes bacterium]|nr:hypothetical protein [Bacillota bacterium]
MKRIFELLSILVRIVVITVLVMAAGGVFPITSSKAVASPFTDELMNRVAKQYPDSIAGINTWLKLKQNLDTSNRTQTISQLAQTAATLAGHQDIAGAVANYTNGTDMKQLVESAVKQEVSQRIGEKANQYQQAIGLVSGLFNNAKLIPKAVVNNDSLAKAPQNWKKMLNLTATAYGPGIQDNGKWNNLTYVGTTVRKGVVAVDPKIIPMGTKLWVEGYGQAVAEDQGSAIKGNRIDLAFNSRQEALDYGIKNVNVYVLE